MSHLFRFDVKVDYMYIFLKSIFPFPASLLLFSLVCIPLTIELIYLLHPPDPCLACFKKRYMARIKKDKKS
jgi:hypothetical protein